MKSSFVRVFVFVALLQCVGIADHSLWTPDEPREGEIIREMAVTGEYLIPHLGGESFLEKPPLYCAVGAVFYHLLGTRFEEAGRLASLIFALATLVVVSLTARRVWSDDEAVLAPLILATFPLFFLSSHKIIVDMGLLFFITAAMCAFLVAYREGRTAWYRVFWVSLAGAFLCKGVIGLVIPGVSLVAFMLWQRDAHFIRQAWVIPGTLLVLGVMAAWAGILYLKGGTGYLYTFYVYNQIGRFIPVGIIYEGGHVRPPLFYLKDIPVQTAPFFLLLIPAVVTARGRLQATEKFLYSWLLGGLLILSLSSTKRSVYFLPMLPAMAMIIAHWMGRVGQGQARPWEINLLKAFLLIILIVAVILPIVYVKFGGSAVVSLAVSVVLFGLFGLLWKRCRGSLPLLAVLGFSLVVLLWVPAVFPQLDKEKSYKGAFEDVGRIVSHRKVMGYHLTETVVALGPFYGHFPVENFMDSELFLNALRKRETEYILVLSGRIDELVIGELAARAQPVYQSGGYIRREIELWKMRSSQ